MQEQSIYDWYRSLDIYSTMNLWWENVLRLQQGKPRLYLSMEDRREWYIENHMKEA